MRSGILKLLSDHARQVYKNFRYKKSILYFFSCIVVFCTTYAMILPALTLETDIVCDKMAHVHAETCYEQNEILTCTEESLVLHEHTENCFDDGGNIVCGICDFVLHTHDLHDCYDDNGNLVCPLEEIIEHRHTDDCYDEYGNIVCGVEEKIAHEHTAECYGINSRLPADLISELLYIEADIVFAEEYHNLYGSDVGPICGKPVLTEHVHSSECFSETSILSCEIEEHEHTEDCYTQDIWRSLGIWFGGFTVNTNSYDAQIDDGGYSDVDGADISYDDNDGSEAADSGNGSDSAKADMEINTDFSDSNVDSGSNKTADMENAETTVDSNTDGEDKETEPPSLGDLIGEALLEILDISAAPEQGGMGSEYITETGGDVSSENIMETQSPQEDYGDVTIDDKKDSELYRPPTSEDFENILSDDDGSQIKNPDDYSNKINDTKIPEENESDMQGPPPPEEFEREEQQKSDGEDVQESENNSSEEDDNLTENDEDNEYDSEIYDPTPSGAVGAAGEFAADVVNSDEEAENEDNLEDLGEFIQTFAETMSVNSSTLNIADVLVNNLDLFSDGNNEEQIVEGKYENNNNGNNTMYKYTEDGVFRIQKKVIPTGTENEFYIYLDMEPVLSWEDVFLMSTMWICNNNSVGDVSGITKESTANEVKRIDGVGGNVSKLIQTNITLTNNNSTQPNKERKVGKINITLNDGSIKTIDVNMHYGLSQGSTNSFTIIFAAPNSDKFLKLSDIMRTNDSPETITIPYAAYKQIVDDSENEKFSILSGKAVPQSVTDPMGEHIEFLGFVDNSGNIINNSQPTNGKAIYDESTKTITWNDFDELSESNNPEDYVVSEGQYYRKNAYQLMYKIRLKTEDEGFVSNENYPTNGITELSYKGTETNKSTFDIPVVKGIKPEPEIPDPVTLNIKKVGVGGNNIDEKPLNGVEFKLMQIDSDNEVEIENGIQISDENGMLVFSELMPGNYRLYEIKAPDGYSPAGPWEVAVRDTGEIAVKNNVGKEIEKTSSGDMDSQEGIIYFKITNNAGTVLPSTGGVGTFDLRFSGVLLMMVSTGYCVIKRRRGRSVR